MDSTAASSLLDALQGSNYSGLYDRFSSLLLPFGDFIPLDSHHPSTGRSTGVAPKKRGASKKKKKKKKPEIDPQPLRTLAKQFLPFLCHYLKLLPTLLCNIPRSPSEGGGREEDEQRVAKLLGIYGLVVESLSCIGPCLSGKPYSVHLQWARLVCSLEAWGRDSRAEKEAISLLESLHSVLVERKSQRGKNAITEDEATSFPDSSLRPFKDRKKAVSLRSAPSSRAASSLPINPESTTTTDSSAATILDTATAEIPAPSISRPPSPPHLRSK